MSTQEEAMNTEELIQQSRGAVAEVLREDNQLFLWGVWLGMIQAARNSR